MDGAMRHLGAMRYSVVGRYLAIYLITFIARRRHLLRAPPPTHTDRLSREVVEAADEHDEDDDA